MFKKVLFLILLVPEAYSGVLELTCEVPMPIHVVYDFDTGEGYLDLPDDGLFIKKGREGKQKITKFREVGDYYIFSLKHPHEIEINRITLRASFEKHPNPMRSDGQCVKGLKTYDKYQI